MAVPRVVVVAQAFKGSLSAPQVGEVLARAVRALGGEPVVVQGSDGGDGFLDSLEHQLMGGEVVGTTDPLGRSVRARIGWLGTETAIIESRLACGLSLLDAGERDPLRATTRGLGALIVAAVERGARRVVIGLGGSATMDGGLGMARVWGWEVLDGKGRPLPDGGGALADLAELRPGRRPSTELVGLCDVRNRLLGPLGARVFARQKGATPEAEARLERGLERLAAAAAEHGGGSLAALEGAGAAGGLGFGLAFFGGAELRPGAPWVLERIGFEGLLEGAAAVVVGEGAFDVTSLGGKLAGEVIARARDAGVPVLLVAPRADGVPPDVVLASGDGWWTADTLERRAVEGLRRLLRLPAP